MYELRPEYQRPIHDATVEHCKLSKTAAFVTASVGAGKTINIGFMAKHIVDKGGKVLVLARQGELIEQNASDAWAIGVKTSIFSASLGKKSVVFPCVMGTEGTVSNHLKDVFTHRFIPDAILIDECHMVPWQDVLKCLESAQDGNDIYEVDTVDANGDKIKPFSQYARIIVHFMLINPKVRIIGYTGSPYRGRSSILGEFWGKELYNVGTMQLISLGYLVPPVFGFGDEELSYHLEKFRMEGGEGAHDYSSKELAAMSREITKQEAVTRAIMQQVMALTKDRNGVLITCASKKHCTQVAEMLPPGTWGIVTDDTSTKKRREVLDKAKSGEIKYVLQIGCLTTGVNVPLWDTAVILRKIGSLTLIIQLLGRVLRQLKQEHIDKGYSKSDALILDYTDTLMEAGDIYDDPILNIAQNTKRQHDNSRIMCPICETANKSHARRCCGVDDSGNRCEHFFQSRQCKACEVPNDITAAECRNCGAMLIDYSTNLLQKPYTDADFKPVKFINVIAAKNNSELIKVEYHLETTYHKDGKEYPEVATEMIFFKANEPFKKANFSKFLMQHCIYNIDRSKIMACRTHVDAAEAIMACAEMPYEITHRINAKGFSIISRKKFAACAEVVNND